MIKKNTVKKIYGFRERDNFDDNRYKRTNDRIKGERGRKK